MKQKLVFSLYKKEMLDILRDKKTIIVMILVPLFLYPAMMVLSLLVMNMVMKDAKEKVYEAACIAPDDSYFYERLLKGTYDKEKEEHYNFHVTAYPTLDAAMEDFEKKDLHVILIKEIVEGKEEFTVLYRTSEMSSTTAYSACRDALTQYNDALRDKLLTEKYGNVDEILHPISIKGKDCSTKEQTAGNFVGMIVPFMLITSILMGALYPAIDATAGERERGTLETMMTLPVKNKELMFAKLLSVSTVAIFSAFLNLLSMLFVFIYMYFSMDLAAIGFEDFKISAFIPSVLVLLLCLPVFALFCSAVCLSVCLFSKTFKEANNYSTPILLIFMFSSMAGIIPEFTLKWQTAFIPIVNIALLIKSVFVMEFDWSVIFVVFFSMILYAFIAVLVMSKLFSSENVMFGEGFHTVKLLERRSNMNANQMPGFGDLILMFSAMLLIMIYSSSALVLKFGLWGTAVCQLVIFLVPAIYAWYMKADYRKLFSLHAPSVLSMILVVLAWVGVWLMEQGLLYLLSRYFGGLTETATNLNESVLSAGFPLALLVVGIMPAIAEETAFRGFLFGTLKEKWRPYLAIVLSAAIFGLYHMNLLQFIAGLMVGCVMAYFVYRSGSIFPSVLIHFLNNSISVVFTFYPQILLKLPILRKEFPSVVDSFILMAIGGAILAVVLLVYEKTLKNRKKI